MADLSLSPIAGVVPGRADTRRRIVTHQQRIIELIVREGADVATLLVDDQGPVHLNRTDLARLCAGADWACETIGAQDRE